jgi:hypothetical protein
MNEEEIRCIVRETVIETLRPLLIAVKQQNGIANSAIDKFCGLGDHKKQQPSN